MTALDLLLKAKQQLTWIEEHLRDLVLQESPSDDKAAVDAAGRLVAAWATDLGFSCKWHKQSRFGDLLELSYGSPQPPVLLLGHLDTVWPINTLESMAWTQLEGRLQGPGVLDMKACVIMALACAKLVRENDLAASFKLLLNSEEEIGSPVSRQITEQLARESQAVFVLEPAQGLAYKTSRKGVGQYLVEVKGVASHSGVDFERGHSAIRELARLVETISGFTNPSRKRTVNCGTIAGGTRSNVVPEYARCEVDVRVATTTDAAEVDALFQSLTPTDPTCFVRVTGGINRPPMERSEGTARLFRRAKGMAAEMGFVLDEAATGGGSDGNFTAALGIPTLDGMGAVGGGAHAANEHVLIEHLAPRVALLAAMIMDTSKPTRS